MAKNNINGRSSGRGKTFSGRGKKDQGGRTSSGGGLSGRSGKNIRDKSESRKSGSAYYPEKSFESKSASRSGRNSLSPGNDTEYRSSIRKAGRKNTDPGKIHPCSDTVVGFHAIEEMLKEGNIEGTLFISGRGKRHEKIAALASSRHIRIQKVSDEILAAKSPGIDPRGVVLEITGRKEQGRETSLKAFLEQLERSGKENSLVLILDRITDPHNLGAILRSADQLDVDLVVLPSRRSAGDNATVRKISSGASEYVMQAVENLSRAADLLKKSGFWIYAADMGGENSWDLNLKGKTALILGSEGEGVSRILTDKSDSIIKIPASGHVDSFNVSVAAGILMYEAVRQQSL